MPLRIHAFQIHYDAASRAALDPGFEPLDNSSNARPDWYEYWPIRRYFSQNRLDDSAYYGFFSPLFRQKTGLTAQQVFAFADGGDADVVTFSPHPCHSAPFYNVFEQGANCFPGFLDVAKLFLHELDPAARLDALVNDSRNTVYCNYFLAKPRFWNAWYGLFNRVFELAEASDSELGKALNQPVTYAKDDGDTKPAQMKIMLMERVASLMLAWGDFTVRNHAPFAMPLTTPYQGRLAELIALDELKIAYARTGDRQALQRFVLQRDKLLGEVVFGRPAQGPAGGGAVGGG